MSGPIALFKTVADLNEAHPAGEQSSGSWYKFVRVDGEYRFAEIEYHCPDHKHLVGNDEKADVAGTISIRSDCWQLQDGFSSTLKLGCGFDDIQDLTQLLQRKGRDRWD